MKPSTVRRLFSVLLLLALAFALALPAEARPGGGRSSGFRGSRGFGTRSAPTSPYKQAPNQYGQQAQPGQTLGQSPGGFMSGGFGRGLLGGLAGGMLGSMLFGSLGHAGGFGGGGMGFLDILLIAGLGFMAFRFFQSRRLAPAAAHRVMNPDEKLRSVEPGPFAPADRLQRGGEDSCARTLARYDSAFELSSFKDARMDDFMKLQASWNHRDLTSLSSSIAPELRRQLDADIDELKVSGRINRIENIAVRGSELIEAWAEGGQEFATVRFRANLTDYTVDEASGQVVAGDRVQPVKFEEDWTFVRPIDGPVSPNSWQICAIEA